MAKDIDGKGFVTDDNSGGFYVCQCDECYAVFSSGDCAGGAALADTGDYDDALCPHCGHVDPGECTNAALVWNVQQRKINALREENERLRAYAAEATKVITGLAGGGSELFTRDGDDFRADLAVCSQKVRDRHLQAHERFTTAVRRATAAEAREKTLQKALKPFATSDMLGFLDRGKVSPESCVAGDCDFTYADLDNARTVYNATQGAAHD